MDKNSNRMRITGFLLSILIYSILFIVPLAVVLSNSNVETIKTILQDSYYLRIIGTTFKQAIISTICSLMVGLPGAWIISHYKFKFKNFVKAIYFIPFILPSILVVLGFVTAYGKNGLINSLLGKNLKILYSFTAVILAHVFYNFPIVCNIVGNKWESLDSNIEDEARSAGANEFVILKQITIPRILPSILSASILIFLFCFSSFAIILVLGGGPKLTTLEVEIYRQARTSLNISNASSLAVISLITATISIILHNYFSNKDSVEESSANKLKLLKNENTLNKIFVLLYLATTILFLLIPVLGIIYRSFSSNILKSLNFKPILTTFIIGINSSLITIFLSVFICSEIRKSKKNIVETAFLIPLATSSVIVGLGYYIVSKYTKSIPTALIVTLCHGVLNIPYAIKSILPVYRSIPDDLIDAAKIDRLDDFAILTRIELRYIKNTVLTTFSFCFALSCGELNSTIMIAGGKFTTIPMQIHRMISAYNFDGACTMGLSLIFICVAVYFVCEKLKDC